MDMGIYAAKGPDLYGFIIIIAFIAGQLSLPDIISLVALQKDIYGIPPAVHMHLAVQPGGFTPLRAVPVNAGQAKAKINGKAPVGPPYALVKGIVGPEEHKIAIVRRQGEDRIFLGHVHPGGQPVPVGAYVVGIIHDRCRFRQLHFYLRIAGLQPAAADHTRTKSDLPYHNGDYNTNVSKRFKYHTNRINAIADIGGRRTVIKHMSQVGIAQFA